MDQIQFVCPYGSCNKKYKNFKSYHRHIDAQHRETVKYQCEICLKRLTSNQALKEHRNTHTGEKPFLCQVPGCSARFRQGSLLSAHKKTHRISPDISKSFRELKVMHMQLTDILREDSCLLGLKPTEYEEISREIIILPKITGEVQPVLSSLIN